MLGPELPEICSICGEPVIEGANELFALKEARRAQDALEHPSEIQKPVPVEAHRYYEAYHHGLRATSVFQADALFPAFEEVVPEFCHRIWLADRRIKRFFTYEWMFRVYEMLHLKWRDTNRPLRMSYFRRRTRELLAKRKQLAAMLRAWLFPILSNSEIGSIFAILLGSMPANEAIERLGEIYDLPKFWVIGPM